MRSCNDPGKAKIGAMVLLGVIGLLLLLPFIPLPASAEEAP